MPIDSTTLSSPLRGLGPLALTISGVEVPQWYRTDALHAGASHPLLHALVEACRKRWGRDDLMLDCQTLDLRPSTAPGLPVWHRLPASSTDEVALVCLGNETLLELADDAPDPHEPAAACRQRLHGLGIGTALPHDRLCFLAAGATVRFRTANVEQPCVVALIRPRDGARLLGRRRHCARVFVASPNAAAGELPAWAHQRDLHFTTGFNVLAPMPEFTQAQVADEPLIAGASPAFARAQGGPITQAWLDRLPAEYLGDDVILVVKRDELSPGWWPAVLGWHMDGTSRANKRADGTPDLRQPYRRQKQVAACVGPASPTALLRGSIALPEIPLNTPQAEGGLVWQRLLLDAIADGTLEATTAPCDTVFSFDWGGFHACSRAAVPGWRLFLKAMHGRGDVPQNRMTTRSSVAWSYDRGDWPDDPCGVFPQELPC